MTIEPIILLDAVTLIETTLDQRRYGDLAVSAPVGSVRRGAQLLIQTLHSNFPVTGQVAGSAAEAGHIRHSHLIAVHTFQNAGLAGQTNSVEAYSERRCRWEPLVRHVAQLLGYTSSDIDRRATVGQNMPPIDA